MSILKSTTPACSCPSRMLVPRDAVELNSNDSSPFNADTKQRKRKERSQCPRQDEATKKTTYDNNKCWTTNPLNPAETRPMPYHPEHRRP